MAFLRCTSPLDPAGPLPPPCDPPDRPIIYEKRSPQPSAPSTGRYLPDGGFKGSRVVNYRKFRNTDPPGLVGVWNDVFTGRGAVKLRTSSPLDRHVFAKPYFDPAGLIVAEEAGACVGFTHVGFGPTKDEKTLAVDSGVTCMIGVRPSHRRRGIGSELLRRGEAYLRERGARQWFAGQMSPLDPFYLGLYGGSALPGFLATDPVVEPFLTRHGYKPVRTATVFQRLLKEPLKIVDARFGGHRARFDIRVSPRLGKCSWWQECVFGLVEPLEFLLEEKPAVKLAARLLVWEMEGFGWRWGKPSVGVTALWVRDDLRRQGIARFFLSQVLRYVQEQFFELAEIHVRESHEAALKLCKCLGFQQVDVGRQYQKQPV
jgi:ribosomal protein S18 acetylase RimI-like enzyme